jgi:hypothetical protein
LLQRRSTNNPVLTAVATKSAQLILVIRNDFAKPFF